jgi:hypothetical protein
MPDLPYACAMVEQHRYPALRRLIPSLPEAFNQWRRRQKELADVRALSRIRPPKFVLIEPRGFETWCEKRALVPDERVLDCYARMLTSDRPPDDAWSKARRSRIVPGF